MDASAKSTGHSASASTLVTASRHEKAIADALFLSIGQGAIVTDVEGKVSHVNETALHILGFEREEIMGKWFPATVIAEDDAGNKLPYIERPIVEIFLSGKSVFRKLRYRRKDGSRVAIALTVSPVLLEGKPVGAIEVFRDITEEVHLNKAKDEFISLASHQLRTPATGVKQYLGMLLEGYAGDLSEEQKRFVETANESNDRQLRIIDDLLRVATADSGNLIITKGMVDLVPLIESVIEEQASRFAARNQHISFTHTLPIIEANIDRNSFRMVLENLIDNAHKYTYSGKNILVRASSSRYHITIDVEDEGTGIAKADFCKLFQKFSRLDNALSIASGGSGLGLYWVKQIIDLHGGTITVRSRPNHGTTFTIRLARPKQ